MTTTSDLTGWGVPLPCPCCGEEATAFTGLPEGEQPAIVCPRPRGCGLNVEAPTIEEAGRQWNRRASPSPDTRAAVLEEAARVCEDTDVEEARGGGMSTYYAQLGDARATLKAAAAAIRSLSPTQGQDSGRDPVDDEAYAAGVRTGRDAAQAEVARLRAAIADTTENIAELAKAIHDRIHPGADWSLLDDEEVAGWYEDAAAAIAVIRERAAKEGG